MQHSPRFLKLVEEAQKKVKEVTASEIHRELQKEKIDFVLIDVREESEWNEGHLPKALFMGKGIIERDIEKKVPDPKQKIVLYCGGGFRSVLSAEALQKMGYSNVLSMQGGVREWKEKKYPFGRD